MTEPYEDRFDPEISDLIVSFDPVTLERLPVRRGEVVARFNALGNRRAARIVSRMPTDARDILDADCVDRLLVRVHAEIQRLSEEFLQGLRVKAILSPVLQAMREAGVAPPHRIVDVGCGPGYMVRWLTAFGDLGEDVEVVGADYHVALIEHARRLARAEGLRCRFEVANAFHLTEPASIYMSVGVIHHFRGPHLATFLKAQDRPEAHAFVHFDIRSSWLAPMGAWLFHVTRMREPLARHDGVLSAIRAHPSEALLAAAAEATGFKTSLFDEDRSPLPILKVMHALVGVRPALTEGVHEALGADRHRLEPFS